MHCRSRSLLSVRQRRRARDLACWNAGLWGLGNGLADITLVVYLALELGAPAVGLGVGLLLAMRYVVGLLRLAAPAVIGRLMARKRFCIAGYALAAGTLLCLPLAAAPGRLPSAGWSLAALVLLWCVYHVLQYLATVGLWSWLGDLVRLPGRSRFLGRRERWLLVGEAAGMLAAGLFAWHFHAYYPSQPRWLGYAVSAMLGAGLMLAAIVPLGLMPAGAAGRVALRGASWRDLLRPLGDPRFLRLLAFGSWLSFFNGVTQSAQNIFPARILGASVLLMLGLKTMMRCGQLAISPSLGRVADRYGNRRMMIPCLLVAAAGPGFYLMAAIDGWQWFMGAWVAWIAYAGINVGQPGLLLKLAPRQTDTPYIATFFAITGLCYAMSTISGGWLMDRYLERSFYLPGGLRLDFYQLSFLAGWITRSLGVVLLWAVVEQEAGRQGPHIPCS